ncbi:MAG TPA: DNA internalization-related competence protein ComEC/Rec2 [Planctomicrobium sp.]|nr:DNA internalization-related competence protein ComEC/Rec2 [Planctomicrobium sp.]
MPHRPALIAAIFLGLGIAVDRQWDVPVWIWLSLAVTFALCTVALCTVIVTWSRRAVRWCSLLVLLLVLCTGGARHHVTWTTSRADDVSLWCSDVPVPVDIQGIVERPVEIHDRPFGPHIPPWMEVDRSISLLRVEQVNLGGEAVPCSGLVRLEVTGHLVDIAVGDRVEVLGTLARPGPPRNPGEFSYDNFLRMQGTRAQLRVNHPAAVRKIDSETGILWTLARWRGEVRKECQRLLARELKPPLRGLAASLLIGDRTELTDELKDQFAETGMMHLIAISGINVGIMIGIVLIFGRMMNLGFRSLACGMILAAVLFTWITDQQPSVIRAGLLVVVTVLGSLLNRRIDGWNALAICALILMIWNPANLFDIGAQFSFLAVAAIFWSSQISLKSLVQERWNIIQDGSLRQRLGFSGMLVLAQMYFVTGAIWLATVPLTMGTFHLITPVGLLLDLLLVPLAMGVLGLGYLFLGVGLLSPWLAGWIAIPFHWGLWIMQTSIAWGQQVPFGHLFVPSIPWWWLFVFYVLLWLTWLRAAHWENWSWGKRIWPVWIILGLLLPFFPSSRSEFRCTFLSVGHGLACVIELPNREVILYDAGTIGDGRRAQRAVERFLWNRGIRVIDTIIVSHSDHDHFSGLFGLLERFPARQLLVSQQSSRSTQSGMEELFQAAITHRVDVKLLQAGDRLHALAAPASISVLHPDGILAGAGDNAHSLVLAVEYSGRRILLTGDLEREGLDAVLSQQDIRCDVLLSPHHGGRDSNIPPLFRRTDPDWVIISSGREHPESLNSAIGERTILNTATSGAVTVIIHSDGQIRLVEHLAKRPRQI